MVDDNAVLNLLLSLDLLGSLALNIDLSILLAFLGEPSAFFSLSSPLDPLVFSAALVDLDGFFGVAGGASSLRE